MEVTIEERLAKLEARIQQEKSWKTTAEKSEEDLKTLNQRFEVLRDQFGKLVDEHEKLQKENAAFTKLKEALSDLLPAVPKPVLNGTINLDAHSLTINVEDKGEKTISMTTDSKEGQILFCAVKDLPLEGFSVRQLVEKLLERGWNIPQIRAANLCSTFIKEGTFIKTTNGYRLPSKVKFEVKEVAVT